MNKLLWQQLTAALLMKVHYFSEQNQILWYIGIFLLFISQMCRRLSVGIAAAKRLSTFVCDHVTTGRYCLLFYNARVDVGTSGALT